MAACSIAEKYRQHDREMKLALELGCTPLEAKHELRRRESLARIAERQRRLDAMRASFRKQADRTDPTGQPWMMQDLDK